MQKSKPKKEKLKIVFIVLVFLSILGIFFFALNTPRQEVYVPIAKVQEIQILPDQTKEAVLEISGVKYESPIEAESSVYDFMNKLQNEGKIKFKDKTYIGMGKFIEELNGIRGNGDKYWIYYVNGKKAKIGVSNYKINPGDVVSWKYEKDIN